MTDRHRLESTKISQWGLASSDFVLLCGSFFFQAEDGIRDLIVTGVQTCALPIYARKAYHDNRGRVALRKDSPWPTMFPREMEFERAFAKAGGPLLAGLDPTGLGGKIGRASCRERV